MATKLENMEVTVFDRYLAEIEPKVLPHLGSNIQADPSIVPTQYILEDGRIIHAMIRQGKWVGLKTGNSLNEQLVVTADVSNGYKAVGVLANTIRSLDDADALKTMRILAPGSWVRVPYNSVNDTTGALSPGDYVVPYNGDPVKYIPKVVYTTSTVGTGSAVTVSLPEANVQNGVPLTVTARDISDPSHSVTVGTPSWNGSAGNYEVDITGTASEIILVQYEWGHDADFLCGKVESILTAAEASARFNAPQPRMMGVVLGSLQTVTETFNPPSSGQISDQAIALSNIPVIQTHPSASFSVVDGSTTLTRDSDYVLQIVGDTAYVRFTSNHVISGSSNITITYSVMTDTTPAAELYGTEGVLGTQGALEIVVM